MLETIKDAVNDAVDEVADAADVVADQAQDEFASLVERVRQHGGSSRREGLFLFR